MTWLFGDSSHSTLEINYIDFLRLALDFSVEVLLAEDALAAGRERRRRLESEHAIEVARLEAFGAAVARTVELEGKSDDSPTGRAAASITRAAADAVKAELAAARTTLAQEVARLELAAASERERCVKALETLLLRHDLPETRTTLQLASTGTSTYVARLRGVTPFGVETLLDLTIPEAHLFAHDVRVDKLSEGLEIKVPEIGGWLRKQSRIAPHRLGKYRIAGLSASGSDVRIELRASHDASAAGFDVTIGGDKPVVRLLPVGKEADGQQDLPFEPDAEDSAKLLQLSERLAGSVGELVHSRRALLDAKLDAEPLAAYLRPATLVERLISVMTPTVLAIAQHSAAPGELVLRRLLGGDRREEVFVSKAELVKKLDKLPPSGQAVFEPLGLDATAGDPAHAARTRPPPAPRPASESIEVDVGMLIEDSGKQSTSS